MLAFSSMFFISYSADWSPILGHCEEAASLSDVSHCEFSYLIRKSPEASPRRAESFPIQSWRAIPLFHSPRVPLTCSFLEYR